ncbi:hypothetical protein RUM4293_01137 [Ruegeria atlantica]|uniref:Uncharacterized protein n=1 Tax=Ruegeria atlantica TaxID=81569 RepID=A0A0P1E247_9RHOB|nr:hypothetical protein RUM4293_00107 [Ruegeria atlantica]CUH42249.1 hypothetical protein RUM4293_01137 [Ruegeria atlantica]
MYNITARRMISGLVLKYLKEAGLVMGKSYATALPRSSKVLLTRPFECCGAADGGFVRRAVFRCNLLERQLCGRSRP